MYPRISYDAGPKNKTLKWKKRRLQQVRESGRNSLFVVMLIIVVGWCPVFASNKDIAFISTIIGLIDHFIGPITIAGIVLLIIVAKFTGNLKLGSGRKSNRKTGNRNAHSRSSSKILSAVAAVLQRWRFIRPLVIVMRIILFLLTLWCLPVLAQQIAVPELRQQVTDITGTLSTSEQQSLTQQLQDITQKHGHRSLY